MEHDVVYFAARAPSADDMTKFMDSLHAEPRGNQRRSDQDGLRANRFERPRGCHDAYLHYVPSCHSSPSGSGSAAYSMCRTRRWLGAVARLEAWSRSGRINNAFPAETEQTTSASFRCRSCICSPESRPKQCEPFKSRSAPFDSWVSSRCSRTVSIFSRTPAGGWTCEIPSFTLQGPKPGTSRRCFTAIVKS